MYRISEVNARSSEVNDQNKSSLKEHNVLFLKEHSLIRAAEMSDVGVVQPSDPRSTLLCTSPCSDLLLSLFLVPFFPFC